MNKHLEEKRKIAYYELCIINLIEAIDGIKEFRYIKNYLKDVIEGVEPNTKQEDTDRITKFFNEIKEKD